MVFVLSTPLNPLSFVEHSNCLENDDEEPRYGKKNRLEAANKRCRVSCGVGSLQRLKDLGQATSATRKKSVAPQRAAGISDCFDG